MRRSKRRALTRLTQSARDDPPNFNVEDVLLPPICAKCHHTACPCCPFPFCDHPDCVGGFGDDSPKPCEDGCDYDLAKWEAWRTWMKQYREIIPSDANYRFIG